MFLRLLLGRTVDGMGLPSWLLLFLLTVETGGKSELHSSLCGPGVLGVCLLERSPHFRDPEKLQRTELGSPTVQTQLSRLQ